MTRISQTIAVGMALLLALSVSVPALAAAQETTTVSVETDAASGVTDQAATLNGNLTELSGADNATVYFEYWVQGDPANSTNTSEMKIGNGTFSWGISGLANDTTYVYAAHANASGTTAEGANQTFTTLAEAPLGVDTLAASDVTPTSATLNGELTGLGGADGATVYFEYWVEGDRNSSTNTSEMTLNETGTFSASISGLSYNDTYVYVAHAEVNPEVTGDQVSFTPTLGEDSEDQPFGYWVSAFVHSLMNSEDSHERNLGQIVSAFVTENNPGADKRPDHAGPPDHAGKDKGDDGADCEVNDDEDSDQSEGCEDVEASDDDKRGPPEHAKNKDKDKGKNKHKSDDSDGSDDSDDSDDSSEA